MLQVDPTYIVVGTLAGSLVLFVTDALRYEITAMLVVIVLALTGCLGTDEAFAGFASPAVILIASMYVFGHAFTRCGVAEEIGKRFLAGQVGGEAGLVLRVTLIAGLLSSMLSNTGVVATLMPVCSTLARHYRLSVSRLLMPMAFGSLVGGLVTVIATSTNIAVNQVISEQGGVPFGLFEFSHFGLVLLGACCLFFIAGGRQLLPRSPVDQSLEERYQVPKFVTEILVEPSSSLINRAVADTDLFSRFGVTVLGIVRAGGENDVLAPGPYNRIRADDTLILQGSPDDILRLNQELPLRPRSSVDAGDTRLYSDDVRLIESVVPAGSVFVGQTLKSSDFRARTGLNVLAFAKHGEVQLQRIQDTMMEVGDTLLLQGHQRDIERTRVGRSLLVLEEVTGHVVGRGAKTTVFLLLLVLVLATFTSLSLPVLALAGAVGLVIFGPVGADELPTAINWAVLLLVGGMLALGSAFDRHGLGDSVAGWLHGLGSAGIGPRALLVIMLVATVALTQVLNNVATAVIMAPVAISVAVEVGIDSRPYLMAVVTGASLAFISPVAHQANAMIMGPGAYRYKDFLRVGIPLTVVMLVISSVLIPVFWPLTPL